MKLVAQVLSFMGRFEKKASSMADQGSALIAGK
jgi:hypothetical protein